MNKTAFLTFMLAAFLAPAAALAENPISGGDPMAGAGPFSDPEFQDMIETSDGYLAPGNTLKVRTDFSDFRDSPISAPVPTLKNPVPAAKPAASAAGMEKAAGPVLPAGHYKVTFAGDSGPMGSYVWPLGEGPRKYAREYVFLSVSVTEKDYAAVLSRLETQTGFRFAGEKTYYSKNSKQTVLLGWAPAANIGKLSRIKGVSGAAVEKKSMGVPLKTKVRFTLKVPYQNRPAAFVPDFLKRLSDEKGFSAENWFRMPQKDAESKFSVFDVTGTMPVETIAELSRSPFVASVEFNDPSL